MPNVEYKSRQKRKANYFSPIIFFVFVVFCVLFLQQTSAQNYLTKRVSLDVKEKKLSHVLEEISQLGGFYFSYNSATVSKDSLVSISVKKRTIEEVLNILLKGNYEYRETPRYVVLRFAPSRLQLISEDHEEYGEIQTVTGFVVDDWTGKKLANASIYDKSLLLSTLSDENGYFKLKLKRGVSSLSLTISKEYYRDTTVILLAPVLVRQRSSGNRSHGYRPGDDLQKVERTTMGHFFVSSKQKLQSLNLGGFFANTPFQTSLTPGLSTHGALSGQVINKFSINFLGGYTSGVNGIELGGGFNINKRDVDYAQVAGLFNLVGGRVKGVQLAGAVNAVLDSVQGVQVAGVYNKVEGSVRGFQLTGGFNIAKGDVHGVQVAGVGNVSRTETSGLQIGGVFNYSKHLKGVQLGLINVADSSSGVSIGVLNFIKGGYRKMLLSNNELTTINLGYKMGNAAFYTVFMGGINVLPNEKALAFGMGFGHDFLFSSRFSISSELSSQNVYLGNWKELSNLYRAKTTLNMNISTRLGVFIGPAFNLYVNEQRTPVLGYKQSFPYAGYSSKTYSSKMKGWLGWELGISLF